MLNEKVCRKIIRFAFERYGHNKKWLRMTERLSGRSIARLYFKEFVNWEDWQK